MLLEISVPVYRRDRWQRLERDGKIQVSGEVDTLSEGYPALKKELDALLDKVNAETKLAENVLTLQLEIEAETQTLNKLKQDIALASEHYANFKIFLENLGIDPRLKKLTFDKHLLLSSGPVEDIEALPDPLDSEF